MKMSNIRCGKIVKRNFGENMVTKHLSPRIELESVVNPGTIFRSYLQEIGPNDMRKS